MNVSQANCPISEPWSQYKPFEHVGMDAFFANAREEEPVFWDEGLQCWILTRREDIQQVFTNPELFSAQNVHDPITPFPPELVAYLRENEFTREKTQANCDQPKHTRIRKAAQSYLNVSRFNALEPRIRELVREGIDAIKGKGQVDMVDDFAYELPARVVFQLLGVPTIDARQIKIWADSRFNMISGSATFEEKMEAGRLLIDFWNYCMEVVADRQENPADDYPSHLLAIHKEDPETLTLNEVKNLTFGILLAGHETTTNAIGMTIYNLLREREQWEKLVEDPSRIPNAVEESLRINPPVVMWRRRTTADTEIGGVSIPEGSDIMMSLSSANRDRSHFTQSDDFDIERGNARQHFSFGKGIHFCLGAPLARLELKIVLEELVRAFPRMALSEDMVPNWQRTILVRGLGKVLVDLNEV